jgi:hypothetical protein
MIDKLYSVKRSKIGAVVGALNDSEMQEVTRKLVMLLGIAG